MTIDKYVEQIYPIKCKGRDSYGNEVLAEPVEVEIIIYKRPESDTISSNVECPYNTGGHGQRCGVPHHKTDEAEKDVGCPYSFDIPYALEKEK